MVLRPASNMILSRQTYGQRSGMAAESKRRALALYFPVRICYMFLILKCRGRLDLCLCITSVLAKRMQLRSADLRQILRPNTFLNRKSALRSHILFASPGLMHKPRSNSPLHFDTRSLYQICAGK